MEFHNQTVEETKKSLARDLTDLLENVPDDFSLEAAQALVAFMHKLLRIKVIVPPVMEIMTLIKRDKPNVYYTAKTKVSTSSHLYMLFQLEADPEIAEQRIREFFDWQ